MSNQLIRRNSYRSMPWRNGGGVTYEICRAPQQGAEFDWRLSLARIDRPGPFSEFRGYRRAIALVSGRGCVLNGAAEIPIRLERPGALATFAGEAAVDCELLGGPCHDLNLMVRTSIPILATRHLVTEADLDSFRVDGACVALFCLEGTIDCVSEHDSLTLQLHDTALIAPDGAGCVRFRHSTERAAAVAFAWGA